MRHRAFERREGKSLAATVAAVLFVVIFPPSPAASQTSGEAQLLVRLDSRRATDLATRSDGPVRVAELLREAGSVELRNGRGMEVLLHVLHLRRGETVRAFRSSPFLVRPDSRVPLSRVLMPSQPDYSTWLEPGHVLEAARRVPVRAALEEPGSLVMDGVFANKPDGWASMDAFYVVAVPRDERQTSVVVGPGVVFAVPKPDY